MENDELIKERECEEIIKKKNYYEILGVSNTADDIEIKKAYKKLAIKFHPDKNSAKKASEAFNKISTAFTILSDKEKRNNYDTYGHEEGLTSENVRFNNNNFDPFVQIYKIEFIRNYV